MKGVVDDRIRPKTLWQFAYDIYYKAVNLIEVKDQVVINLDDEIVKEIIKNYIPELQDGKA